MMVDGERRKLLNILLVEDNEADVVLLREALRETHRPTRLNVCVNGAEALSYLDGANDGDKPDLVLLDLNIPGLDGHGLLRHIKRNKNTWRIPTVVLTSSTADEDISQSYDQAANGFIVKPVIMEDLVEALNNVMDYWFDTVHPPGGSQAFGKA